MMRVLVGSLRVCALASVVVACGKTASKQEAADKPAAAEKRAVETEPQELAGIRFSAPKGSTYEAKGDDEKVIAGKRYRVTIEKLPTKQKLDAFKEIVGTEPGASKVTGKQTARGWELRYFSDVATTAAGRTVYIDYVQVSDDEQYQCRYDDEDSPDVASAAAICNSIASK